MFTTKILFVGLITAEATYALYTLNKLGLFDKAKDKVNDWHFKQQQKWANDEMPSNTFEAVVVS